MEKGEFRIIEFHFANDVKKVEWTGRKNIEKVDMTLFFVFHKKWDNCGILYSFEIINDRDYAEMKNKGWEKMLKPCERAAHTEDEVTSILEDRKRGLARTFILKSMVDETGNPEDYGIKLPEVHCAGNITLKTQVAKCIPAGAAEIIRSRFKTCIITGNGRSLPSINTNIGACSRLDESYETYCTGCGGKNTIEYKLYNLRQTCSCCGYMESLVDKGFKKKLDNEMNQSGHHSFGLEKTKSASRFLYITAKENCIEIFKTHYYINSVNGTVTEKITVDSRLVYEVDGKNQCYTICGDEEEPCNSADALFYSGKEFPTMIFEDAKAFDQFLYNHEDFFKKIGFMEILKYNNNLLYAQTMFLKYIAIIMEYPVIEQLVKMGHVNLFLSMCKKTGGADSMQDTIDKLNDLVNRDETKGKNALRFPQYIGDYLIRKNADIAEYFVWVDIYELTNISKENFEKLIDSYVFCASNSVDNLGDLCNILKYGYSLEKLLNYIVKTYIKRIEKDAGEYMHNGECYISVSDIIYELRDYLMFCEELHVVPDMYPMDLKKQHDDIVATRTNVLMLMRSAKTEAERKLLERRQAMLKEIGEKTEALLKCPEKTENGKLPAGIPKDYDEYVVKIPKEEQDFLSEGNMQHNCVGGYYQHVLTGKCQVFFLRKKNSPDQSYITGECKDGKIRQFLLSNNRGVGSANLKKIGKYIAKTIDAGITSGEIPSLKA